MILEPTDTELMQRWQQYETARYAAGGDVGDFLLERERIERAFRDLIERRCNGTLTDNTRVGPLVGIIQGVVQFAGVDAECRMSEYRLNTGSRKLSWLWHVIAVSLSDAANEQIPKLAKRVDEELASSALVEFVDVPAMTGWIRPDGEMLRDAPARSEDYELAINPNAGGPEWRRYAGWVVDTKVWEGPETIRKQLRKRWS